MRSLKDLGEFGLIQEISSRFSASLGASGSQTSSILESSNNLGLSSLGIGDDCAWIQGAPHSVENGWAITTDLMIEDIHFKRDWGSPQDLGFKLAQVNLSDLAAAGSQPRFCFLSLALPPTLPSPYVEGILEGLREALSEWGVVLLGGDTTASPGPIVLNLLVMGEVSRLNFKGRGGAVPGDKIVVTGYLGDSSGGLMLLEQRKDQNSPNRPEERTLIQRHLRPKAHVKEGIWLGQFSEVHAVMDVSDGIGSDLNRIAERSGCGFKVQVESLPLSSSLKSCSERYGWDPYNHMISGGEDYCLLAVVASSKISEVSEGFLREFQRPLTIIGEICEKNRKDPKDPKDLSDQREFLLRGSPIKIKTLGFDHFKS